MAESKIKVYDAEPFDIEYEVDISPDVHVSPEFLGNFRMETFTERELFRVSPPEANEENIYIITFSERFFVSNYENHELTLSSFAKEDPEIRIKLTDGLFDNIRRGLE